MFFAKYNYAPLSVARRDFEAGLFSSALDKLRPLTAGNVSLETAYFMGECFLAKGLLDQATETFNEGLRKWPENPFMTYGLGLIARERERKDEVSRLGQLALTQIGKFRGSVSDGELLLLKGNTLRLLERDSESRPILIEALDRGSDAATTLLYLAKIEMGPENFAGAHELLLRASQERPIPEVLALLALMCSALGRNEQAATWIDSALNLAPNSAVVNLMAHMVACSVSNREAATHYLGRVGACEYFLIRELYHPVSKSYTKEVLTTGNGCVITILCVLLTVCVVALN